jgi:hypothetical protein
MQEEGYLNPKPLYPAVVVPVSRAVKIPLSHALFPCVADGDQDRSGKSQLRLVAAAWSAAPF